MPAGISIQYDPMISSQEVQARAETLSLRFDRVRLIRHVEIKTVMKAICLM